MKPHAKAYRRGSNDRGAAVGIRVAIANLKGGVGKSTTSLMLAEGLAYYHNKQVLVLDLDPQANLSFMLLSRSGVEDTDQAGRSLARYMKAVRLGEHEDLSSFLHQSASDIRDLRRNQRLGRVDLLPSLPGLRFEELAYERQAYRTGPDDVDPARALADAFQRDLDWAARTYDIILIDCPPGFSTLSRAGLLLADVIVSPTIADAISVRAMKDFVEIGLRENLNLGGLPHHVVITKFISNQDSESQRNLLRRTYSVIEPSVPHRVDVIRAATPKRQNQTRGFREKWSNATGIVKALAENANRVFSSHVRTQ